MGPNQLERLLTELRDAHPNMERIFLHGKCYSLWNIVRTVFPESECWYSQVEGHVYIKYQDRFYDIRGVRRQLPNDIAPLNHRMMHKPHRWGFDVKIDLDVEEK